MTNEARYLNLTPLKYAAMKSLYIITLTLAILLSQLGSLEHAYHEHDSGEACEYCLSAHPFDTAILSAEFITPAYPLSFHLNQAKLSLFTESRFNHYSARAPPSFT